MSRYLPEPEYRHGTAEKTAVLLINLGTPEAPTTSAVRRYLQEFLSDPRVVEIPRAVWWLILNGIILNVRPRKSAEKYALIWTPEGSPLQVHTKRQATMLRGFLGEAKHRVVVDYAMRYGQPSIPTTLSRLKTEGCTRFLLLPLYPQYSSSTTASAFDAAFAWAASIRNQPELRTLRSYAGHPGYVEALASSVREHWMTNGRPHASYRLIMSFHGVPRYTLDKGDPYHCECHKTARLLAEALNLGADEYQISFQSRFGRTEWLQPYTAQTLAALGKQGVQTVDVICPGFPADCLETLEEIAMEGKAEFIRAGGKAYRYIPCLNERDDWIHALADLASTHLQGWPTRDIPNTSALETSALRAKSLGAMS
ncbi:Ferrochelatase [Candidatus Propionivibrio aalborgensis]|uniref:Ferrochelatase n=1 Tax=Candidatus Propionivibrio aalborgensis TaxID=1860101 RepID=A0A1A8XUD4_9RHOO|nr:ferrochelatase [Candidatus Propionivibrio aalborgensis]MBK7327048.1 ferrochelatase [Propionivibrio sp.]MBK7565946.1 ferrochelatase [Propionivibrio sp.]MBK9026493.1 ferrochelatase [Propionivibrio sp.]SBT08167.1 Ferrochelatase [Candidatus Propionivibrio aalborgensis]HRC59983.1 ferrochelatase [Candidatus Propionivibrio aalborgensis]